MSRYLGSLVALLWVVSSACSGGGISSGSSSGGGSSQEPAVLLGYRTLALARCDYFERCKDVRGSAFSSAEVCRRFADADLLANHGTYERLDLGYAVDDVALAACTSSMGQAICLDVAPYAAMECPGLLKPRTALPAGASCWPPMTAGAPRCGPMQVNYCAVTTGACGLCTAALANAATCRFGDECQSGVCGPSGTCAGPARGTAGQSESCALDADCAPPLVCAGAAATGLACQRRALRGEACGGEQAACARDLYCVDNLCADRLPAGEVCSRTGGANVCLDHCAFDAAEAATGHCAALDHLPGDSEPCAVQEVDGTRSTLCATGLAANLRQETVGSTSCVCRSHAEGGASCASDDACRSGVCDGDSATVRGMCTALKMDGTTCSANKYCESGYCDMGRAIPECAPAPSCL